MSGILRKLLDMWSHSEESEMEDLVEDNEKDGVISKTDNPKVLNIHRGSTKIVCFKPVEYGVEILKIADSLIDGKVVVLDLEVETTASDIARRIIDFLRGIIHAKRGKFVKVSKNTYVLTPSDVEINGTELVNELENHDIYI
ncbi:MAG: cell division protein SepF [Firmicutes bacterium]|nr:cell division protein SepF [Bacillota bacterium]